MTGRLGARLLVRFSKYRVAGSRVMSTLLLGMLSLVCFGLMVGPARAADSRLPVARHAIARKRVVGRIVAGKRVVQRIVSQHVVQPIARRVIARRVIWHPPVHLAPVERRPAIRRVAWHRAILRRPVLRAIVRRRPVWHSAVAYGPRMSCVPFARAATGMDIAGDAYAWWHNAAGRYARGDAPVPGSVLAFRANGRMRLGHVAVVARVINRREIEVDQANWGDYGRITRGVPVIDVSEDNNWSDVRVAIGGGRFGSVYPTYGFIYDRPDTGTLLASRAPAPEIATNAPPAHLRALHPYGGGVQEAMAPEHLPAPPHWPAQLGHRLHVSYVHHVTYRRPTAHVILRHAPIHRVVVRHGIVHRG